jgi:hypothetical protein
VQRVAQEIHLDVLVSKSLFAQRQAPWSLPTEVDCLFFSAPEERSADYQRPVRGRHAFASSQRLDHLTISHLDLTRGRLDLSKIAGVLNMEMWDCTIGDFGLRWPAKVRSLELNRCTFQDQCQSFELPDDLQHLDMSDMTIAGADPTWQLPATLTTLYTRDSSIATRELPASLPLTLRTVECSTEHLTPRLRTQSYPQSYPQSIREIEIRHRDRAPEQTRRIKLFKRNWQRKLTQKHPEARVEIR